MGQGNTGRRQASLTPDTAVSYHGTISGTGGVTIAGTSSQRFSFSQAYTGDTIIESGTLAVTRSLASHVIDVRQGGTFRVSDDPPYTLSTHQTLKGEGTVVGALETYGTVAPGGRIGILTVGPITFADGSELDIELAGTSKGVDCDLLVSAGMVSLETGSTLLVTLAPPFSPRNGDAFDVLDFSSLVGTFSTLNLPVLGGTLSWNTDALYTEGLIAIVPEPATLALVALGGLGALLRRGRK